MKWKFLCIAFLCTQGLLAQQNKGITFDTLRSWDQIKAAARQHDKYIFVDVFATWCGPCRLMDRSVYTNDTVAGLMNEKFISIRLQMDSTPGDNDYVRKWYADARSFAEKYRFQGYPSFLFFTPQGQLVLQDIGYKTVTAFDEMSRLALEPQRAEYSRLLEDYQKGKKNYPVMGELSVFARDVAKEKTLAETVAKDYKTNYLDKLPAKDLCSQAILSFIGQFNYLIRPMDGIFALCYTQGSRVDSIMHMTGWAAFQVDQALLRDEIQPRLVKDGRPVSSNPDWRRIQSEVQNKYKVSDITLLMLNERIRYYSVYRDWRRWADAINEKLASYPPDKTNRLDVFMQLNIPAWQAFLDCKDRSVLRKALKWSDLSIALEQPQPDIQLLDTRAQLLYKLGRVEEGIAQEEKAIEASAEMVRQTGSDRGNFVKEFTETLAKMKRKDQTWN